MFIVCSVAASGRGDSIFDRSMNSIGQLLGFLQRRSLPATLSRSQQFENSFLVCPDSGNVQVLNSTERRFREQPRRLLEDICVTLHWI
jgi:hypothetical protein